MAMLPAARDEPSDVARIGGKFRESCDLPLFVAVAMREIDSHTR
jgi:hypothetical protein